MEGVYSAPETSKQYEGTAITGLGGFVVYLNRYGNICTLTINTTTNANIPAWSENPPIATVPARYRPAGQHYFYNVLGRSVGNSVDVGFAFYTDGKIVPSAMIPSGTAIWATITYIAQNRD